MTVSIITIGYNISAYIRYTVESIISQSFEDWEFIYVDDGSTDNSVEIVEGYGHQRIRVLKHVHCANLSILRNAGAKIARGRYVAFVDGDDVYTKDKLERQLELFERNPEVHWSHTNALTLIDESNALEPRKMYLPPIEEFTDSQHALKLFLKKNFAYISSFMARKTVFDAIGGFNEQLQYGEDIEIYIRLLINKFNMGYIKEPCLHYRIRGSSLYRTKTITYLNKNIELYYEIIAQYPEVAKRFKQPIDEHLSLYHKKLAIEQIRNNVGGWRRSLWEAFLFDPTDVKNVLWLVSSVVGRSVLFLIIKKRESEFN